MEQEILIQVSREREKQKTETRGKECKLLDEVWVQIDPGRKPSSWERPQDLYTMQTHCQRC